jgi:uncharacterized phage protein (TIGR02218 family)
MISTTLNSETVYLLPYQPNWDDAHVLTPSINSEVVKSSGGIERRQAFAASLLSDYSFRLQLYGTENTAFRVALQTLGKTRVLCPFWPSAQTSAAITPPAFTTGLWLIAQGDISEWEVNETGVASAFTPDDTAFRVPLMLGIFSKPIDPDDDTSDEIDVKITFREGGDADYALTPTETDGTAGPTLPNSEIPKIFPLSPNWSKQPESGGATVDITRSNIGFGREQASTFYPQASSRPISLGVTAETSAQAAALVSFFAKRQGIVEPFWLPGVLKECALTTATNGVSAVLHVDDVSALGDNEWIALLKIADDSLELFHIESRDVGAKTITLNAAPAAHTASSVRIVSAIVARFKKPSFGISFITPEVADAAVSFIEVPTEYEAQADEVIGVTHGALPRVAFLYKFTRNYPGGTITDRFTSYERPIVIGGSETYAKDKDTFIEHGDINDTLDPERTTVALTSRVFSGNPLLLLLPNQLEGNLYLEILECFPDEDGEAATANSLFYGTVSRPQFTGPKIKAEVAHILRDLGRAVPRWTVQPTCNYEVFSAACSKDPTGFTFDVEVLAISGNELTVDLASDPDYFSFGRAWFGSGSTYQGRSIYASAASGPWTIITVDNPFSSSVVVGGTIKIRAGCDKLYATCSGKFENAPSFGGAPFVPVGNPSLVKIVQNETEGGKK